MEPVFANICSAHRLRRFSLRSKKKVNTQWLLYCMVHNIGKLQRFGDAENTVKEDRTRMTDRARSGRT